jgi:cobalamin biosynthesis protein CobD/CbiB
MTDLTQEELTQEETNRLYSLSAIPAVLIFAIVTVYYSFVHLEQVYPPRSLMWDLLLNLFPPVITGMPVAFFATFEILCSRKLRSPLNLHAKRFLGRMATVLIGALSFVASYIASYFLLVPLISERHAVLASFLIWLLILGILVSKFKHFFSNLEKGKW